MALSTLDERSALVVIDLQHGIVAYPLAHPVDGVIERSVALIDAFRARGLPVVLVNVAGGAPGRNEQPKPSGERPANWAELIEQLNRQPGDLCVTKKTWGAFASTELHAHLRALKVTQIVLCGVATSIGVESTARQAYELGYNVTLATDAMTDMNAGAHENSVQRIFPRLGECGSAQDVMALLRA